MSKATITCIKRNNIIKKKKKNNRYIFYSIIIVAIISFVIASYSFDIRQAMVYVYNPVNSLYNDTGEIIFTSGDVLNIDKIDMVIPIKCESYEISNSGDIEFLVGSSIMVTSVEDGVVIDTGLSVNNVKYIKIRHSEKLYSIIENVDIIGVSVGDVVKKGKDIATGIGGSIIRLKIFSEDKQINNLSINQSKIVWVE